MDAGSSQPPMMTFKQFLASQDDGIDDQEAVKKYNEYKLEFRRQQINEFFLNHKEEEWFRIKYHPEESTKRRLDLTVGLKRRLDVFMELYGKNWLDTISIDQENSEQIIRYLDAVVIKLEGGSDFDLKVLDEPFEEEKPKEMVPFHPSKEDKKTKEDEEEEEEEEIKEKPKIVEENNKNGKKRKRSRDSDSGDDDDSSAVSDTDSEPAPPGLDEEIEINRISENGERNKKKKPARRRSDSLSEKEDTLDKDDSMEKDDSIDKSDLVEKEDSVEKDFGVENNESLEKDESIEKEEGEEETADEPEKKMEEDGEVVVKEEDDEPSNVEEKQEPEEPKPRALHKTFSIFLRYLAPTITKQEVEAMCKRFCGYLRVAIADPQPERRFVRRAWVTFERSVNIKEMCWNLNGIRLRDNELGAIVNRDLSRRIRSVNGISSHKQVVRSDIKLAARIVQNLDKQKKLWDEDDEKDIEEEQGFNMVSKNPLLKNITDYLIEEASAEEEELLGTSDQDENKNGEEGCTLERDEVLIKVLDRLLMYLRVVHSVDYYNNSEYPSEDEMPNRCGIMHARGSPPSSKVTQQEITEYITNFEQKSCIFLQTPTKMVDEESLKLGKKDPDVETEKFIQANTQELSKDKWLCPLSGKKFKGPEFVRKHIYNKHGEKIEEVKKEVEYFNNYLVDPKRPQLPDHPSNRPPGGRSDMHGNMGPHFHGGPFPPPPPPYGFGPRGPGPNFGGFGGQNYGRGPEWKRSGGFGNRNYQRRSPRSDPRKLITYRDLDAPNDMDLF